MAALPPDLELLAPGTGGLDFLSEIPFQGNRRASGGGLGGLAGLAGGGALGLGGGHSLDIKSSASADGDVTIDSGGRFGDFNVGTGAGGGLIAMLVLPVVLLVGLAVFVAGRRKRR
jgi:hypothetical protein